MKRILIFQPIFQKYLRMDIQELWSNIKQILINTPYFFCKKRTYNESNKMKQDKFKKMITSGEQMEEKRENIETELLEEAIFRSRGTG